MNKIIVYFRISFVTEIVDYFLLAIVISVQAQVKPKILNADF